MLEKAFSKDAKLKPRFIDNTKIFKRVMKMLKMIFPPKVEEENEGESFMVNIGDKEVTE